MYARRIQITNYGPIEQLDIEFPFDDEGRPKPVVLVGENGSGKSIFLSHIVNGLVYAKGVAYDLSPEVPLDHVYKTRSANYITFGREYYFTRVDYSNGLFTTELHAIRRRSDYHEGSPGFTMPDAIALWDSMDPQEQGVSNTFGHHPTLAPSPHFETIQDAFANNCILYFPADRFDDPGWLAAANLPAELGHNQGRERVAGTTTRKVIASSMLRDVQNWILDVMLSVALPGTPERDQDQRALKAIEEVITDVVGWRDIRFFVGSRGRRSIGIISPDGQRLRNIFQLSSGETGLLTLFLSILRDYDLCERTQLNIPEVSGIVVVDEIDLHLHVKHQIEVLPRLMRMLPQVQFIVTTHSPLFVLGMNNAFDDDGFALYEMPQGRLISAEEFREFGNAYQAFAETRSFEEDLKRKLVASQKPVLYVEGTTDAAYLRAAADRLEHSALLDRFDLSGIGGKGQLSNTWAALQKLESQATETVAPRVVLLLHDPEYEGDPDSIGNVFRRAMPLMADRRITKGIENLFPNEAIERARQAKPAHIDIERPHSRIVRGQETDVPEQWTVNEDEKANLCQWFCENGTAEDFGDFAGVFNILEEVLQSANQDEGASD